MLMRPQTNLSEESKVTEMPIIEKLSVEDMKSMFEWEFKFLGEILDKDAKNYHCWSHHIWLVERFNYWNNPNLMPTCDILMSMDVTNNSVWSFRYFLVIRRADHAAKTDPSKGFNKDLVEREIEIAFGWLKQDWMNEAAWSYIRGFIALTKQEAE